MKLEIFKDSLDRHLLEILVQIFCFGAGAWIK